MAATSTDSSSAVRTRAAPSYIDPAALMRIKSLQLRAKVVVDGFYNGLHRSPFHGFSAEFSEYRPYTAGDDLRYLDWRLFARSDRYYIKRFEDETNRRCQMIVDLSRSMGYTSLAYTKADYARTVIATLAYYLNLQRDSVGLMTFDETISDFIAARHRPGHMHRLMVCLERSLSGRGTDLQTPLERIASLCKKRGLIIFISDLLGPIDALRTNLSHLRSRGHEVLVLRVLDPAELSFPFSDQTMVLDMESGREIYMDPDAARTTYQRQFRAHHESIRSACADLGVDYTQLLTDQPLEHALFDLLHAQVRRGRRILRRHAARPGSIARGQQ